MKGKVDKILGRYREKDTGINTGSGTFADLNITSVDASLEVTEEGGVFDIKINAKKLVYIAFISQAGAAAPAAADVLENTLTPALTRYGVGEYDFTKAGAFTLAKTGVIDDLYYDQSGNKYTINRISDNVLRLRTYAAANTAALADGVLNSRYINIEAYL